MSSLTPREREQIIRESRETVLANNISDIGLTKQELEKGWYSWVDAASAGGSMLWVKEIVTNPRWWFGVILLGEKELVGFGRNEDLYNPEWMGLKDAVKDLSDLPRHVADGYELDPDDYPELGEKSLQIAKAAYSGLIELGLRENNPLYVIPVRDIINEIYDEMANLDEKNLELTAQGVTPREEKDCNNPQTVFLNEMGEVENIIFLDETDYRGVVITYCFEYDEIDGLLTNPRNPYTRRKLRQGFIDRLKRIQQQIPQQIQQPPEETLNQLVARIVERAPYFPTDQFLALNRPQLYGLAHQLAQRGIISWSQLTDWNDSLELEEFKRKIIEHVIDTSQEQFFDTVMYRYLETEEPELPDPQLEQTRRLIRRLTQNLEDNPDNTVIQQQLEQLRRREQSLLPPSPQPEITQIFPPPLSPPPPGGGPGRFRTMEPRALTFTTAPSIPTNEEYDGEVEDDNNAIQNYIRDGDAEGLREYFQEPNPGLRGEEVYAIEHSASKEVLRVLVDEMIASREGGVNLRMFQIAVEESLDNMLEELLEVIMESAVMVDEIFYKLIDADDQDLLMLAIDRIGDDEDNDKARNIMRTLMDHQHPVTQEHIQLARSDANIYIINWLEETYNEQQGAYVGEMIDDDNVIQNYIRDDDAEGLQEYFLGPNPGLRGEEIYAMVETPSEDIFRVLVDEMIANREGGINPRMFRRVAEDDALRRLIKVINESQGEERANEIIQSIFQKFIDIDEDLLMDTIDDIGYDEDNITAWNIFIILLENHHPVTQEHIQKATEYSDDGMMLEELTSHI